MLVLQLAHHPVPNVARQALFALSNLIGDDVNKNALLKIDGLRTLIGLQMMGKKEVSSGSRCFKSYMHDSSRASWCGFLIGGYLF